MLYLLIFLLIILLFEAYWLSKRDLISPWVIVCAMFLISTLFVVPNQATWSIESFHLKTVYTIVFALIFWGAGTLSANYFIPVSLKRRHIFISDSHFYNIKRIRLNWGVYAIFMLIFSFGVYTYFQETYRLSLLGGNPGGYSLMLKYARTAQFSQQLTVNRLARHLETFTKAGCHVFTWLFFYNFFSLKRNWKDFLYLVPTFLYCLILVLTSGRLDFISLIGFYIIVGIYFWRSSKGRYFKGTLKILFLAVALFSTFLIAFYYLGNLTGKSAVLNLTETVSIYAGSSIYALDVYLQNPPPPNTFFGSETLLAIYSVLGKLGLRIPSLYSPREFIFLGEYSTNIYTALRRYIQDYGFVGMFAIQFALGYIYNLYYQVIKERELKGWNILFYAALTYPLFQYSIDERFLLKVVSLSMFYEIIYTFFIYIIVVYCSKRMKIVPYVYPVK